MTFYDHIAVAKEEFKSSDIAYNFIQKAEMLFSDRNFSQASQSLSYACRVLIEQGYSREAPGVKNLLSARNIANAEGKNAK